MYIHMLYLDAIPVIIVIGWWPPIISTNVENVHSKSSVFSVVRRTPPKITD